MSSYISISDVFILNHIGSHQSSFTANSIHAGDTNQPFTDIYHAESTQSANTRNCQFQSILNSLSFLSIVLSHVSVQLVLYIFSGDDNATIA
jgi:hypothetical protein